MGKKLLVAAIVVLGLIYFINTRAEFENGNTEVAIPILNNGYFQSTKIDIEGIEGTCYGTLLSRRAVSGKLSARDPFNQPVPEKVKEFFLNFKDEDSYFFLNYLQDVSGGLLDWRNYPPEEFKVLLYFPDSDTYYVTEKETRYSLTSPFLLKLEDESLRISRNYDYLALILRIIFRTAVPLLMAVLISIFIGRPVAGQWKNILLINLIPLLILNIIIAIYSFKVGFSRAEYLGIIWLYFVPLVPLIGYYYSRKAKSVGSPYFCAFLGCVLAYAVGFVLIDSFPALFTMA